jgi:hypothetical protein
LVAERKRAATALGGLRGALERTKVQEREALAKALKEGKAEPKASKVEEIEKKIEALERRLEAVEEAIDIALADLHVCVDDHRNEWCDDALSRVAEAQAQYVEAVEAVAGAVSAVHANVALLRFARQFPDDELAYRVRSSFVASLRGLNGDPYLVHDVLQALRDDARVQFDPQAFRSLDPLARATHELHEQRRKNEVEKGHYMTDAEISLYESAPEQFFSGAGVRVIRPRKLNEEGENDGE